MESNDMTLAKIRHFVNQGFEQHGIIHCGANDGEEVYDYIDWGYNNILCFEPLPSAVRIFKEVFEVPIIQKAVSDFNGKSILEVALKYNFYLHHNFFVVCACSTCHLSIDKGEDLVEELISKEEDFIDRSISPNLSSRLGSQFILPSFGVTL